MLFHAHEKRRKTAAASPLHHSPLSHPPPLFLSPSLLNALFLLLRGTLCADAGPRGPWPGLRMSIQLRTLYLGIMVNRRCSKLPVTMGATSWNGTGVSASAGAQTAVYYPQHGYITEVKLPAGAAIYQQSPHSLATYHTLPPLSKYGLTIADSAPITAVNLADVGWDILAVLFAASSQNGPGLWVFEYSFVSGSWAAPYNLPVSSSSTYGTVEWISGTTWAKTSSERRDRAVETLKLTKRL